MDQLEHLDAAFARRWWLELMENCTALLEDAAVLLIHGSPGRTQALHVLALEELAKALWIYESAEDAWTEQHETVPIPPDLEKRAVKHLPKLMKALTFDHQLEAFWGDYSAFMDLPPTDTTLTSCSSRWAPGTARCRTSGTA